MHVLLHYDEIALKRGKRHEFEQELLRQAEDRLEADGSIDDTRLCLATDLEQHEVQERAERLFGVKNFAFPQVVDRDIDAMRDAVRTLLADKRGSVAVDAKRADKDFRLTSHELQEKLGDVAVDAGHAIDLNDPANTVFVELTHDRAYLYCDKIDGPGGLPVGTAGDVLCLLSGGIDSPVAAWQMMKRGCNVDFLHFNPYATGAEALERKLGDVLEELNRYQDSCELYFAPYGVYQLGSSVDAEYDLVAFRHCMLRTAVSLAKNEGYQAVVTGDSVAQVASQTLNNLGGAELHIDFPILRPLVGLDKEEIVEQARQIGTYRASIKAYKDCCSIIADSPNTGVSRETMRDVLAEEDMETIVEETVAATERVTVPDSD